ncbi:Aste57867_19559 [Aphanomyces stellatus]|uniref:Aste57867_19559 protein n=1 Tax=Aphanomyces stellatus TaxID=120398 RepID=A0A485LD26_9STRA|nr:hypothetical protein As57867_019495 [Aphanomyces stellatus]VFT96264.1 Aste57867_19559 [Aphanomyces stellatus]
MNPDASVFSVGTFEFMGLLSPVDSARLRSSLVPGHLHKYLASETGLAMGVVVLHSGDVLWYFQVNEDNHALPDGQSRVKATCISNSLWFNHVHLSAPKQQTEPVGCHAKTHKRSRQSALNHERDSGV